MKRHTAEEVITKLRQAEADLAQGLTLAQLCQRLGVSEPTLHRWRNQYGGLKQDEAKRLKELEGARPANHVEQAACKVRARRITWDKLRAKGVGPRSDTAPQAEGG